MSRKTVVRKEGTMIFRIYLSYPIYEEESDLGTKV